MTAHTCLKAYGDQPGIPASYYGPMYHASIRECAACDYEAFLRAKTHWVQEGASIDPESMSDRLFPFQRYLTAWALSNRRAALLTDCGTGKGPMQLFWADYVHRVTGRPVIIATPLAVSFQMAAEAEHFDIEAGVSRNGKPVAGVTITNYEQLEHFDRDDFAGMSCDESSILKSFDGVTKGLITDFMRHMPWRLLASATAAPNDYIELGTSSEALGFLGYMDMLSRFFTNDQHTVRHGGHGLWRKVSDWRFKGHAEAAFWQWVTSWARSMRKPSDLGFDDAGFELQPLHVRQHVVATDAQANGTLFALPAVGLQEERQEVRQTLTQRCEKAAELLAGAERGVAWCQLNAEGDLLTKLIDGAVQVKGSDAPEAKEEALLAFTRGDIRVMVTKPSIGGWGLNWQHCHRMTYFPSHSYEEYYQAVRRCHRFGQEHPVQVDLVTTEGGANALENLQRKAAAADRMFEALVAHMRGAQAVEPVSYDKTVEVPAWLS